MIMMIENQQRSCEGCTMTRYQIFVSSTYTDLIEERQAVVDSILKLRHIPVGMEQFVAANEEQFNYIKRLIDETDYYILIIGNRYGSTCEDGISYTEKEFDYAVSKGIPVLAFVHSEPDSLPVNKSEKTVAARKHLSKFREKVMAHRLVSSFSWDNPDSLSRDVVVALTNVIHDCPRPGWKRVDYDQTPKADSDGMKNESGKNIALPAAAKQIDEISVLTNSKDVNQDNLVDNEVITQRPVPISNNIEKYVIRGTIIIFFASLILCILILFVNRDRLNNDDSANVGSTSAATISTTMAGTVSTSPLLTYTATIEYQNRTASSVQLRVCWTSTLKAGAYNVYGQNFRISVGDIYTETVVARFNTWASSASYDRANTGRSDWITIPLDTTEATTFYMNVYYWMTNLDGTDMHYYDGAPCVDTIWLIDIPEYKSENN